VIIKLTVQSCGKDRFRLGINSDDSLNYFKCRGIKVIVLLSKTKKVEVKTTCGSPCDDNGIQIKGFKKGYDLYHEEIDNWIKLKGFHDYPLRKPTKIHFSYTKRSNGDIVLVYPEDNLTTRFNPFNVVHKMKNK